MSIEITLHQHPSELDLSLPRSHPSPLRSDEETDELVRRLAVHYTDARQPGLTPHVPSGGRQTDTSAQGVVRFAGAPLQARSYG